MDELTCAQYGMDEPPWREGTSPRAVADRRRVLCGLDQPALTPAAKARRRSARLVEAIRRYTS